MIKDLDERVRERREREEEEYRPLEEYDRKKDEVRVSFTVPIALHEKFRKLIPWGVRGRFFTTIVGLALKEIEKNGPACIGATLMGEYDPLFRREVKDG